MKIPYFNRVNGFVSAISHNFYIKIRQIVLSLHPKLEHYGKNTYTHQRDGTLSAVRIPYRRIDACLHPPGALQPLPCQWQFQERCARHSFWHTTSALFMWSDTHSHVTAT